MREPLLYEGEMVDLSVAEAEAHSDEMGREIATRKVVSEDMPSKETELMFSRIEKIAIATKSVRR